MALGLLVILREKMCPLPNSLNTPSNLMSPRTFHNFKDHNANLTLLKTQNKRPNICCNKFKRLLLKSDFTYQSPSPINKGIDEISKLVDWTIHFKFYIPANLLEPEPRQVTMQEAGVRLAEACMVETTEGSRTWKQPTSMGMSTKSSTGPKKRVAPLSCDVTVWLTLKWIQPSTAA